MEQDIVYVLINGAMPGYVKIGITNNLEERLRTLDNTPLPLPFECFYACRVENASEVERRIHDAFDDHRTRSNREFFEIAPERVVSVLKLVELEEITPGVDYVETEEDLAALGRARKKRGRFNFDIVDVPMGSILKFSRDENIVCKVVDSNHVEYEGEVFSLSLAALNVLKKLGYDWKSVQGSQYWMYDGEILEERRKRMDDGE